MHVFTYRPVTARTGKRAQFEFEIVKEEYLGEFEGRSG